jgi:RNA polymerase sigma factor (sigma-70 family)
MRFAEAAAPDPRRCLAHQSVKFGCGAHKLGLPACASATIGRNTLLRDADSRAGGHRFMAIQPFQPNSPNTPIDSSVTLPEATVSFDYERALRACAAGDRAALQGLYQQEGRHLLGVALRIVRQRQQAEDVLHDAFMNIWTKAGSFDATLGSGRGWIYSVVRNLAFNAVRNGAREVSVDEETAEALDAASSMDAHHQQTEAFELRADLGKLNDCLSRLEPARRNCILYAYVDGCSHGEIAERTQTPLGTVKAWIKRGMGSLRECMA